jgi:hypothetical protein
MGGGPYTITTSAPTTAPPKNSSNEDFVRIPVCSGICNLNGQVIVGYPRLGKVFAPGTVSPGTTLSPTTLGH